MSKTILIAIDKFKGSLTSIQAAQAIKRGILKACEERKENSIDPTDLLFEIVPIADGGDGSADVIKSVMGDSHVAEVKTVAVNPLGEEIETSFLTYFKPDRKCAFIEMAKISGLALIAEQERNPLKTTTYGLGQLVKEAYAQGARNITLSIGGSATNDGGTGMLQALGFEFYNKAGELITDYMCGGLLGELGRIEAPLQNELDDCKISVICDVTNPLLGDNGATYVYGPQKGADEQIIKKLESGMRNYAEVAGKMMQSEDGRSTRVCMEKIADVKKSNLLDNAHILPGSGAAGGVGYAVIRFMNGNLVNGWRYFAEITNLKEKIERADIIISGEGKIDSQSFSGKVIDGIFTMVKECNEKAVAENMSGKKVLLFCGINEIENPVKNAGSEYHSSVDYKIHSLKSIEPDTGKCMQNAAELLEQLAFIQFDNML